MTTTTCRTPFHLTEVTQKVTSGPWAEPIDLVEAKLQTRQGIDSNTEDSIIRGYISDARAKVERDTMRVLLWQTRTITLDEWPDRIELWACPVRSVESITYVDGNGDTLTLATTVYKTRLDLEPATISLKSGQSWPTLLNESGCITVTFTAGYAVPFTANASTDVLTFTGYTPTDGDSFRLTNSGGTLPGGLSTNTKYYVVSSSGSTCKLSLTSGGSAIDLTTPGTGVHMLGEVPQSALQAMRQLIAVSFVAREGDIPDSCHQSVRSTLQSIQYTSPC